VSIKPSALPFNVELLHLLILFMLCYFFRFVKNKDIKYDFNKISEIYTVCIVRPERGLILHIKIAYTSGYSFHSFIHSLHLHH